MRDWTSKESLIRILLIVSIATITIIGINALSDFSSGLFGTIGNAAMTVIMPFSIAFLLSFIINPLSGIIQDKLKFNRTLSIVIAIFIGIVFIVFILAMTITFIVTQIMSISQTLIDNIDNEALQGFLDSVNQMVYQYVNFDNFDETLEELERQGITIEVLTTWLRDTAGFIVSFASSAISVGFTVILTPVFMYYLIKDRTRVFQGIASVFPSRIRRHIKALGVRSDGVIRSYFIGHGLVMSFITLFFIVTYSILSFFVPNFNIGYAILFAVIMGLFSIIPYIGVWISMSMPIALFATEHIKSDETTYIYIIAIIMIFVLNIIEEILESTIVQPNIFSHQVRIHPLAVLSSFLFFGALFGLVGVILAVPIAGTIKVTYNYFKDLNRSKETQSRQSISTSSQKS